MLKVSGEWRIAAESQCDTEELKYEAISFELRGLHPDTRYRMQVRAHNLLGFSAPAQLYVQTALGEYNKQNSETPLQAGFYDVYTAPTELSYSAASITTTSIIVLFASLYFFLWNVTFYFCIVSVLVNNNVSFETVL